MPNPDVLMVRLGLVNAQKALTDIDLLLEHSSEQWGRHQMLRYAESLQKAIDLLREFPEIGHTETRLRKKQRLYHFGSHTIVYSVRDGDIYIARVLHQRMSLKKRLK